MRTCRRVFVFKVVEKVTDAVLPLLLVCLSLYGLRKKRDFYADLLSGAESGLRLVASLAPSLIILLSAISMLRESGFLDVLTKAFSPLCRFVGIPPELVPLMLVRPISGSAALAVGAELMKAHGPDSLVGRTAAVMLGSTETTFYTISVYLGAAGIRKTRYCVPAAVIADLVGFFAAAMSVRLFFGNS